MKNFYLRLAGIFLLGMVGLLASAAFGQKESSGSRRRTELTFKRDNC
jgi:hypothetical protein